MTDVDQAAWQPDADTIERANLTAAIREQGLSSYAELHELVDR